MQFSTASIVAIALYATSAYGKCFNTGQNWGDHSVAKEQLRQACIQLAGPYNPHQTASRCRNSPSSNVSYRFEIENTTNQRSGISADECMRNIGAQIDNCGHGGEIINSGTRFRYVNYVYIYIYMQQVDMTCEN